MNIGRPPEGYDQRYMADLVSQLQAEIERLHAQFRDIEVGQGCRIIFTDTADGERKPLVLTSGSLTVGAAL